MNFVWSVPLGIIYILILIPFFMLLNSNNPEAAVEQMQIWSIAIQPISFFMTFYIMIVQPVIAGIFVETNSIIQALNVGYALRMFRANWKQFLGVALLTYAASYAASFVGLVLLCIGLLFTTPAAMAISYHLYGQAYRNALAKVN